MKTNKLSVFDVLKIVGGSLSVLCGLLAALCGTAFNSYTFLFYFYIIFCASLVFICIVTLIQSKKNGDNKGVKKGIAVSVVIYVLSIINIILLFVSEPFIAEAVSTFEVLNKGITSAEIKSQYIYNATTSINVAIIVNTIHAIIFAVMILLFSLYAVKFSFKKYPLKND